MTTPPVRLGIIGCGAVTELCHLPAARRTDEVTVVALADKNIARARQLGKRFGVDNCTEDYHEFLKTVDGVIVALPNHLHAPVAREVLELAIPVLVEKPLALTAQEARGVVETARRLKAPLQVGHVYRYSEATRLVKRTIEEGWLGPLKGFSLVYGAMFNWPVTSGSFWQKEQAGGGVLLDLGSHMLDLLLWWLGDVVDVEYQDDSLGGVEADCALSLTVKSPTEVVRGTVVLSRLRNLASGARVIGRHFTLELRLYGMYEVRIRPSAWPDETLSFVSDFGAPTGDFYGRLFAEQLRAFARAIREGDQPAVSGESALATLELIDRCYRERKPLELPWLRPDILSA